MNWDGSPFAGAKLAALHDNCLLAYRRDDTAGTPFPGLIDLPGGGRKGNETPTECVLRELSEAFGITIAAQRLHYNRIYHLGDGTSVSHFFAAYLTEVDITKAQFGDAGQDWAMMPMVDFIADDESVPLLRDWVAQYRAAETVVRCLDTAP